METVEIKILQYVFVFARLNWREEFSVKFPEKSNPYRVLLSYALQSVSGLPVNSLEEASKIIDSLPNPIMTRVYKVWKGSFPASRKFITASLYKAPEPLEHSKIVEQEERELEQQADSSVAMMEAKFGKNEVYEARKLSERILKASNLAGATPATPEDDE